MYQLFFFVESQAGNPALDESGAIFTLFHSGEIVAQLIPQGLHETGFDASRKGLRARLAPAMSDRRSRKRPEDGIFEHRTFELGFSHAKRFSPQDREKSK
jgi:hypothetical protein